jgi:O-antigen ligase
MAALAVLCGLALALLSFGQLAVLGGVVLALIAVVAILAEPVAGVALALIAGPFQPLERVALQLPIDSGQAALMLAILSYGVRWLATRRSPIVPLHSPIVIAVAVFIGVCLLSFFPAHDFGDWANECLKWVQILLIALLVGNERDARKRTFVLGAILLSAAAQAVYGIVQADVRGFGPREFRVFGSETRFRAYGTFEQPNPFGGYMGLVWPVAAALAAYFAACLLNSRFRASKRKTLRAAAYPLLLVLSASTTILCLLALLASGSRGALAGAAAAAMAMVLVMFKRPLRWIALIALAVFLLFAFDRLDVIPAAVRDQVSALVEGTSSLDVRDAHITPLTFSVIERLAHWQAAVRMAEAHPWLGVGFGNYAAAYPEFRLLLWDNALGHAHNYYLNILAETGAVGLLTYAGMWLTIIIVTIRNARSSRTAGFGAQPAIRGPLSSFLLPIASPQAALAVGILGVWAHLAVHHLFDNLYVANMHMLLGAYLGFLIAGRDARAAPHS